MKRKKYLRIFQDFMSRSLLVILLLILIVNLVMPDRQISELENRSLTQFPKIALDRMADGSFAKEFSDWFCDQFVGRDFMIQSKYIVQKCLGQKEINNVFLSKKGLMNEINEPNYEQMDRNLTAINNYYRLFSIDTIVMMNPDAANVNSDSLPKYAQTLNQSEQIQNIYSTLNKEIQCLDIESTLKAHKDEYLYYKTDHHWTTLGAYYAFTEFAKSRGFEIPSIDEYEKQIVSYDFEGTLASKAGSVGIQDEVEIWIDPNTPDYIVTNFDDGSSKRTVYNSAALSTKNPYEVFFGGNHSLMRIEMNNDSQRHLMLFKDSYANALIPFLLPYYRTITVVDPRYYYYDDVIDMMQKYLITESLYCYETNTFVQDTSLADVLVFNLKYFGLEE